MFGLLFFFSLKMHLTLKEERKKNKSHNLRDVLDPNSDNIKRLIMKINVVSSGDYILMRYDNDKNIYHIAMTSPYMTSDSESFGDAILDFESKLDKHIEDIRRRLNKV
jgi:hypothetical protein